jgi:hypothetical protein
MHKIFVGLITLIIAALVVSPVAFAIPTPSGGDNQNTGGVIVGDNNKQIVVSEHTDNNYNGETEQNAKSIVNGNGNKVNTVNNNVNVNGDVTNGATSVSNNQQMTFVVPKSTSYYGLDFGIVDQEIISLYSGQVLVVMNDDKGNLQRAGETYRYEVTSSLPVLTYVVNANEANRAEFDLTVAPEFDPYRKKFDLGNLDTIYVSDFRSPSQTFDVTVPEDGRYALVIDTRVSQSLDGKLTPITADTIDITYVVARGTNMGECQLTRDVIGTTEMFKLFENGEADTSQTITIDN